MFGDVQQWFKQRVSPRHDRRMVKGLGPLVKLFVEKLGTVLVSSEVDPENDLLLVLAVPIPAAMIFQFAEAMVTAMIFQLFFNF